MTCKDPPVPAIIIGAGPAGLAAAFCLARRGVECRLLEKGSRCAAAMRLADPEMILRSPTSLTRLPGMQVPADVPRFMKMRTFIALLEKYQQQHALQVTCHANVESVSREGGGFAIRYRNEGGRVHTLKAASVVNASGAITTPHFPSGLDPAHCSLRWMHSLDVRPGHLKDAGTLLVVGTGISAGETLSMWLGVRKPSQSCFQSTLSGPRHMPNPVLGLDVHYWIYLPERFPVAWARPVAERLKPPMMAPEVNIALKKGVIRSVAGFERCQGETAVLADGQRLRPDLLVFATGYRYATDHLSDLLDYDSFGRPLAPFCRSTRTPHLYLLGYEFGRTFASRFIRGIARDAEYISRRIARQQGL